MLGIKPGPHKRSQRLPLRDWNGIPDITKPAEKFFSDKVILKDNLKDLDIRVCNICYYHANSQKLTDDIRMVKGKFLQHQQTYKYLFQMQPHLIAVAFCFSLNSDVSMMFRRHGIFSEMIITHDIRCITTRPDATLSPQQMEFLSQIGQLFII